MTLTFAGLMCHAPIVIPDVAGPRAEQCVKTTRAMTELGHRVVRGRPDRLVLISPHSPRHAQGFAAWPGPHVGDMGDFGAPHLRIELPDASEVAQTLGLPLNNGPGIHPVPRPRWLDHGAMVPLHFLWAAGWRGPTAILALPWDNAPQSEALGKALAQLPGRTAVVASGDMSHRLKEGAPAGFHPHAQAFDDGFVAGLRAGDWSAACAAPWREQAAEDVVDSARVAMGAAGKPLCAEVLAYEGPWGVGYTEAVFYDPAPPLYAVARQAIHQQVLGSAFEIPDGGPPCAGTFVTLRRDGSLRGCIGAVHPPENGTYAQVVQNARGAAFRDPRFPPVEAADLEGLSIEVSVLEPAESIDGPHQLDPAIYGVIVNAEERRGVMLPDVDGIDTVEEQIRLTCRKVGIDPQSALRLSRFKVQKDAQP